MDKRIGIYMSRLVLFYAIAVILGDFFEADLGDGINNLS